MKTYIVSGYMRTGTSMMMQALEAGGLNAVSNPKREKMNDQYGDKHYKPNAGGFYELERKQMSQQGFPRMYEGKLIKVMHGVTWRLVVGDYKIVFMLRDSEEIRQSYEAFFGTPLPDAFQGYDEMMKDTIDYLRVRGDVDLTVFQYRWVLEHPDLAFDKLKKKGWDIDVDKAVSIVDPNLIRFKKENLTIGI